MKELFDKDLSSGWETEYNQIKGNNNITALILRLYIKTTTTVDCSKLKFTSIIITCSEKNLVALEYKFGYVQAITPRPTTSIVNCIPFNMNINDHNLHPSHQARGEGACRPAEQLWAITKVAKNQILPGRICCVLKCCCCCCLPEILINYGARWV